MSVVSDPATGQHRDPVSTEPDPVQRCHVVTFAALCDQWVRRGGFRACRPPCVDPGCEPDCGHGCPSDCEGRHDPQGIRPGDLWVIGSTSWEVVSYTDGEVTVVQRAHTGLNPRIVRFLV